MKMGAHPANLIFRFLLETVGLVAIGAWGWSQGSGLLRYVFALLAPLAAAALWGTFGVPGDPSREGRPPVVVPGLLRLSLEIGFFGFAVWGLAETGQVLLAWVYGGMLLAHYALSIDRIAWLFHRGEPGAHPLAHRKMK